MYKRTVFALKEFFRFFKKEFYLLFHSIYISVFYLMVIGFNLALLFNIQYLKEADAFQSDNDLMPHLFEKIYFLGRYEIIFYLLFFFILIAYFNLNREKIKLFIARFEEELVLIKKIKGTTCEGKLVLSYLIIFSNFLAALIAWTAAYYIYNLLSNLSIFYLLDFSCFKITLFMILLLTSEAVGIFSLYYLLWKRSLR